MIVLNKIYTKTGDAGETALGNGARVAKYSQRVTAYGTVDEANATVGMARLHADSALSAALARIQNDLFDLGADLCRPDMERDAEAEYTPLRMVKAQVDRLESEIDAMNSELEPETVNADAVKYLNRLSDWFFVAARVANENGRADILWVPGANR